MHFAIPETQDFVDDSGSSYTGYHVYINGKFHCIVRYRQLHNLHEQLKKEYDTSIVPYFPPKKFLPLSANQREERRSLLEKFIQKVGQHPDLVSSEVVNSFLLNAQVETFEEEDRECSLDVFLSNGYKVTLSVRSTERSHQVLEKVCRHISLPDAYVYYFYLFIVENLEERNHSKIVRKLQDFESPFITQKALPESNRITLRKNYWDPSYDLELITDPVALSLLFVQAKSEVECGWVICDQSSCEKLDLLQKSGSNIEYLNLVRSLKFYGYVQFEPCVADYPFVGAPVLINIGNYELSMRLYADELRSSSPASDGVFKVTRMRCWRITTLHEGNSQNNKLLEFELSFEYLIAKDKLMWITVSSSQAILMSICLQSMVDELLLKKNGLKRKMPGDIVQKQHWSYIKRDGSSQLLSSSQSSSSDGFPSSLSSGSQSSSASTNAEGVSPATSSTSSSMKRLSEKFANVKFKSLSSKSRNTISHQTAPIENDLFDGIGDDDL